MEINAWTQALRRHYDKAIDYFKNGGRDAEGCFTPEEKNTLATIGLKPIDVFNYAEDWVSSEEPDWDTFLLTASVRRDYFLHEQEGKSHPAETPEKDLPPRKATLDGIEWLPRIITKARCFLTGGLCPEIMYGCGGDRHFLKTYQIHPADFLRVVWASRGDDDKILAHVKQASTTKKSMGV